MKKVWVRGVFHRYINGTRGAISLFLAILMVPFVSIAGALINAARINSAVAVFDEALCNASNSTLGTYDSFLKKRFGLLAMAQNTSSMGIEYSAQDLILETFQFYMEQNLGVLSNTYMSSEYDAMGVYPLSDTDVLLTEVLEYSKYTIPTKLVIDGFSLDDLLKKLTKDLSVGEKVLNSMNSGLSLGTKLDDCQTKIDKLTKTFEEYEAAKQQYADRYASFDAAVTNYNDTVEEMKREVAKCEAEVRSAEAAVAAADESTISAALAALDAAEKALRDTIDKYHKILVPLRAYVTAGKSDYAAALTDLGDVVKKLGDDAYAAQKSAIDLEAASVSLAKDTVSAMTTAEQSATDNNLESLKSQQKDAKDRGDTAAVGDLDIKIAEAEQKKVDLENAGTWAGAVDSATSEAANSLNKFASENYLAQFSKTYEKIIELRNSAENNYLIPTDDEYSPETSPYYVDYKMPLSKAEVAKLLENFASEVAESSFFAILRALIGFIKALYTYTIWFDPLLCSTIDASGYSSIGGLPSQRKKSSGGELTETEKKIQETLEGDKKKSDAYKELIGVYAGDALTLEGASALEKTMEALMEDVDTITACLDEMTDNAPQFFANLAKLVKAIASMIGHMLTLMGQLIQMLLENIYEKLLLAGYIGYNVPNRTTYGGSALTGQAYNLPRVESEYQGIGFYGAEAEYILIGTNSEILNQTLVFPIVLLLRVGFNIPAILSSAEVKAVAAAVGAPTFGIGLVLVYLLYTVSEAFADTLILVNGGDVPVIKTKVYLTPSGLWDFAEKFVKLKLNSEQKASVNNEITKLLNGVSVDGENVADRYESALEELSSKGDGLDESKEGSSKKVADLFSIDYTQILIIAMVFKSGSTLLNRLSDVIQMEATYNSKVESVSSYTFDLNQSYTYLRASGRFAANEFIRLSDSDSLNSRERIVYRGY